MFKQSWFRTAMPLQILFVVLAMGGIVGYSLAKPNKEPASNQVLVLLQNGTQTKSFAIGIGKVVGTDKDSGMLIIQPDRAWTPDKAVAALKKRRGVRLVLPASAKDINESSLSSLKNHVAYLHAIDDKNPQKGDEEDHEDFYDALKYYMERHVAVGSDTVDLQAVRAGVEHKAQMPSAFIGVSQSNLAPTSIDLTAWTFMGPKNLGVAANLYNGAPPIAGRVTCLAYDPTNANIIYAGSGGGGLWKTTNAGATWACISDVKPWIYPAVSSIAVDPTNPQIIYAGTGDFDGFYPGYNQGVMKSINGGATWTNLASTISGIYDEAVSRIAIDPSNHLIVTITTGRGSYQGPGSNEGNIWRSTDGGTTWTASTLGAYNYCSLTISPVDGTYYASANSFPSFFKSVNHGLTWTAITQPGNTASNLSSIACSKVKAGLIFALVSYSSKVYKSTDYGSTWTDITAGMPGSANSENNWQQAKYDYFIGTVKAPSTTAGELLFVGLLTVCYSANDGANWVDYANSYQSIATSPALIHTDQHVFATSPTDATQCLIGNDGGVFQVTITGYKSGSPLLASKSLNAGLGITQFYQIAPHPTDPNQILGGAQDNDSPSVVKGISNFANWVDLRIGDGGWCGWNVAKNSYLTSSEFGNTNLYNLTTNAYTYIQPDTTEGSEFIAPVVFSSDGTKIYMGRQSLQSYTIASGTNQFVVGQDLGNYLTVIATVAGDPKTIYIGEGDGTTGFTTNTGSTWIGIGGGPSAAVGAICPSASNEHDVLVGYQNTGINHLWQCKNTLAASPVLTEVSGTGTTGLPDAPISAIVRSPFSPATNWFVATDLGVYVTYNAGVTWANGSSNLPEVQIYDLKYADGFLWAGTFGRGIWRIEIGLPLSTFTLSAPAVVGGASLTGTVTLTGAAATSGEVVTLRSNSVDAVVPVSVTVPSGQTHAAFAITTKYVSAATTATITATTGSVVRSVALKLNPVLPTLLTLLHPSVVGGTNSAVTVYLNGKAPTGGFKVSLSSSSADATVVSAITIPATLTSGSALVATKGVAAITSVTMTATYGTTSVHATLSLTPATLSSIKASPTPVVGGNPTTLTVLLNGEAGPAGSVVALKSSSADIVVPASLKVAAGATSAALSLKTLAVKVSTPVTLTATYGTVSTTFVVTLSP